MQRLDLFAAPVFLVGIPDVDAFNRELSAILLEEEQTSSGLQRSNYGGWHSNMDLPRRPQACFQELTRSILEHVDQMIARLAAPAPAAPAYTLAMVHAWGMIMRNGDYTIVHDHGEATWSTVYYVDVGDAGHDPASGGLVFTDARPGVRPIPELGLFPANAMVQPRSGDLVIFPGWLRHQVTTYRGNRPRVSIAANVVMQVEPSAVDRSPAGEDRADVPSCAVRVS